MRHKALQTPARDADCAPPIFKCATKRGEAPGAEKSEDVPFFGVRCPVFGTVLSFCYLSSFASARLSRVTHWQASTDQTEQIVRWVAVAAALAQSRSRRVPGHLHLGHFIKKLQVHYEKLEFKDKVA